MRKQIVVVCGPTAVGKTKFAIEIARAIGGEIVSADSMQLYRFMNIGSAKPTKEEMERCPHHLVDCIDPREPFSVARFRDMAKEAIEQLFRQGKIPVISGGTGLYVNSLIYDMDFSAPPGDGTRRQELYELAEKEGSDAVHAILKQEDPEAAARIHPNNLKKVVRAIESAESGCKVPSFSQSFHPTADYEVLLVGLTRERGELYDRINQRVDLMIEEGLVEEVRGLLQMGLTEEDISMKGIGYKELISYFSGNCSMEDAILKMKQNTRHLAKRQLTWFRRYSELQWFSVSDYPDDESCIEEIISWLKKQ